MLANLHLGSGPIDAILLTTTHARDDFLPLCAAWTLAKSTLPAAIHHSMPLSSCCLATYGRHSIVSDVRSYHHTVQYFFALSCLEETSDRRTEITPENYYPSACIAVWTRECRCSLQVDHGSLLQYLEPLHVINDVIRSVRPHVDIGRHSGVLVISGVGVVRSSQTFFADFDLV
jgi:hypothetical protein